MNFYSERSKKLFVQFTKWYFVVVVVAFAQGTVSNPWIEQNHDDDGDENDKMKCILLSEIGIENHVKNKEDAKSGYYFLKKKNEFFSQ